MTPSPLLYVRNLLVSLFQAEELDMFVYLYIGQGLLPTGAPSLVLLAFRAAREMEQRGHLQDPMFWQLLVGERPRREDDIRAVEQHFRRPTTPNIYVEVPASLPKPAPARRSLVERIRENPSSSRTSVGSLNNGGAGVRFLSDSHDLMADLFPSIATFGRMQSVSPVADMMKSFNQIAKLNENPVAEMLRSVEAAFLPTKELFDRVAVTANYPIAHA